MEIVRLDLKRALLFLQKPVVCVVHPVCVGHEGDSRNRLHTAGQEGDSRNRLHSAGHEGDSRNRHHHRLHLCHTAGHEEDSRNRHL